MEKIKFLALALVSLVTSAMLWVDGLFTRVAIERSMTSTQIVDSGAEAGHFAFWRLWVPLLVVQIVIVILIHRQSADPQQRKIIYFGVFFFLTASLFALTGFQQLQSALQ